ncbi:MULTISPECIES: leucine-rich repeat domain-containing protein [Pseudoalteromonas]|uniref:leucine-rich repeat domain-containing protein n=1 Tax=Pseudoalteromonas TaxID=53246 RepID=UPI00158323CE|nr:MULTISPECIES: hypothetical protein [Pseudoalteromonas]MDI4651706.1 hypothetical protein [Pseudoalteromonas shioyasakiensis]NUJ38036.1 hypothetical protein [Pseudoalteromonas sp. 0303]
MLIQKRLLAAVFGTLFLVGCGGGSDSETKLDPVDPVNQSPTVTISAESEGAEQASFKLSAAATDSDGSIASYSWTSDASFDFVQSDGLTSAEATFQTPDIDADTTVNFTVTVTDNDGATTSAKHSVIFKRNVSTVTITGIVTDQPIANAELEINVGSDVFSVNADQTGRYTIELVVDESASDKLVLVKAKGLDSTNPGVVFVSQLSSIQALLEQAGEDNTLDSEDNFGVNITNVTTAEYALLTRNNEEPQSVEELNAALLNVDADEKILLATLIKIIVDNADYVLPEGVESTLDLVSDGDIAKNFEDEVNEKDPDLIEETKEEIKKDENLVSDSDEPIVGDFIVNSPRYYNNDAYHLFMASDGTGELNANTSSTLTMSKESGVYTLALANSVVTYTDEYNDGNESYIEQTKLTDISFQVLAENEVFRTIEVTQTTQRTLDYQNGSEPVVEPSVTRTYTTNLIDKAKTIALNTTELTENTWVLDLRDNDYDSASSDDEPETLRFYADGTGDVTGESSEVFSWELDDTKLSISYDENGETGLIAFWFTKALSAGYQVVALDTSFDEPSNTLTGLMVKKANVTTTDEDIIGRWHGFVGTSQSYDLNIYPDGSVAIGLDYSGFQGHIEDGNFSRKRFYSETYGLVSSCDGFADDCYLESEMQHEFINIVGSTYYIIRTLTYYTMGGEAYDEVKSVFIYEYSKDFSYSAFTEELLDGSISLYKDDSSTDAIYSQYNDLGEVKYVVRFDGVEHMATFNDGVLSYQVDGNTWFVELVSADENAITICRYQQGSSCSTDTQISYLPKRPKITLTVNPSQNGSLSPSSQTSYWYQYASFVISPDEGYVVDEITGCEGYIEGDYYLVYTTGADCDITATFKPALLAAGEYIINNSDLYNAPAYELLLNEDQSGSFTYDRKDAITWSEVNNSIEIIPVNSIVIDEYIAFPFVGEQQVETHYRTEISSVSLTAYPEKGTNWYWSIITYEYYENDVWIRSGTEQSNVYLHTETNYITTTELELLGEWTVGDATYDNSILIMSLNENGEGSFTDVTTNELENFSWQITDEHLTITSIENNSTETVYFTKDINVGYQFLVSGSDDDGSYTDSGILVRRNVQAISAANFAGRHEFREGHDLDSHWADIQVYDDGQVFFTFNTSLYQKGFEDGHLKRDLYYDTETWQPVDWCDISQANCELYGEFEYTLVAVDGNRYYVERLTNYYNDNQLIDSYAYLYVHDYSSSTKVDQFEDYDMGFTLYQNDDNGIARWSVSYSDYDAELDKQYYTFQLDDAEPINIELLDGKLELILDGQDTVIELIDNNRRDITFCKYLKGNSCLEEDKVYLSFDAPEHTITVNSDENGSLAVGDESIVRHGSNWWTSINPNSGYELDTISGCEGFINDEGNYEISFVSQSCQIDVTFKELVPLSIKANITDTVLAMCVDNSGYTRLEETTELFCAWSGNGEVKSLEGLESFSNLEAFHISELNLGSGDIDLSQYSNLRIIGIHNSGVTSLLVYDPSIITELYLTSNQLKSIELSEYTNLVRLDLSQNELTSIDLSQAPSLNHLALKNNELLSIDLDVNILLEELIINNNRLLELDLFQNNQLVVLNASNLAINELDLSNLNNLESLSLDYTAISNLDFSLLSSLTNISLRGVEQSLVPWEQIYHVSRLGIGGQDYTSFDFSPFTRLIYLSVGDSSITDFSTIANPQQLQTLDIWGNNLLTQLDISTMTSLQHFYLQSTAVTQIDFANNTNLEYVSAWNNPLRTVSGIEGITNNYANLNFESNPLSAETQAYLDDLRDNQGYYNIFYSLSYTVTVNITGNGSVSDTEMHLQDGETRGIYLYPDTGYEVASVTGCDGIWHSADYYEVGPITASCEVDVEFVELNP